VDALQVQFLFICWCGPVLTAAMLMCSKTFLGVADASFAEMWTAASIAYFIMTSNPLFWPGLPPYAGVIVNFVIAVFLLWWQRKRDRLRAARAYGAKSLARIARLVRKLREAQA
jgi:hypothetical protein